MIETLEGGSPRVLAFRLSGRLTAADYDAFVPRVDAVLARGEGQRLLAILDDFHGWEPGAAWEDLKFGIRHYADFERIALVGDRRWEEWMAILCRPFTRAEVRYFDASDLDSAWGWAREGTDTA